MGDMINWVIALIATAVALIQLHKWGWIHKLRIIFELNKWAFKQKVEDISRIYVENESYAQKIGRRHKAIREEHLKLSPREMSNFYGELSASEVNLCEKGEKEIPNELLEKFINFFSVNKDHIDIGEKYIFEIKYHGLVEYIKEGYEPIILCPPREKEHKPSTIQYMWSFIYLIKKENGFEKSFQYGNPLGFYSTGGGKGNVKKLICALLVNNKDTSLPIISVNSKLWKKVLSNNFYLTDDKLLPFYAHIEHQETYYDWVDEVTDKHEKTNGC